MPHTLADRLRPVRLQLLLLAVQLALVVAWLAASPWDGGHPVLATGLILASLAFDGWVIASAVLILRRRRAA